MSRVVEVLAIALSLGYRWLEKLDADRAQAFPFRDSLRDDPLRVLMQQTGGKTSDPVHAHSDKSENRGAGRGEGLVDR